MGEGLWSGWKTVRMMEGIAPAVEITSVRSVGGASRTDVGALAGFFGEVTMRSWYPSDNKSLRFRMVASLGGSSAGFDGVVEQVSMGGLRLSLSSSFSNPFASGRLYRSADPGLRSALDMGVFRKSPHALFARAGYALRLRSVGSLYDTAIELPRGEAGYHLDAGEYGVEARLEGALLLAGRFNLDEDRRKLGGSLAWGGHGTIHARRAHLDVSWQRITEPLFSKAERGPGPAGTTRVEVFACLRLRQRDPGEYFRRVKYRNVLCLREFFEQGNLTRPDGSQRDAAALFLGISWGIDGLD